MSMSSDLKKILFSLFSQRMILSSKRFLYVYVNIKGANLFGMKLRPWDNIRINFSQNKPNLRFQSIKLELLEIFEIQTWKVVLWEKCV